MKMSSLLRAAAAAAVRWQPRRAWWAGGTRWPGGRPRLSSPFSSASPQSPPLRPPPSQLRATAEDLRLLTVVQLRALLRALGQPSGGRTKQELVLQAAAAAAAGSGGATAAPAPLPPDFANAIVVARAKKQAAAERKVQAAAARASRGPGPVRVAVPRSPTPPPGQQHEHHHGYLHSRRCDSGEVAAARGSGSGGDGEGGGRSSCSGHHRQGLLSVVTWNVAGLRGFLKRDAAVANLRRVVREHAVDVVCLQETKLQECHVEPVRAAFLRSCLLGEGEDGEDGEEGEEGEANTGRGRSGGDDAGVWQTHFACSVARKGYSGVVTAWDTRRVVCAHAFSGGVEATGDEEGRTVTLRARVVAAAVPGAVSHVHTTTDEGAAADRAERPFTLVNCYVPNSGEGLRRLEYRVNVWDPALAAHAAAEAMQGAAGWATTETDGVASRKEGAAVATATTTTTTTTVGASAPPSPRHTTLVTGDFNVAVDSTDHFDADDPRSQRYAGRSPAEKASAVAHWHGGWRGRAAAAGNDDGNASTTTSASTAEDGVADGAGGDDVVAPLWVDAFRVCHPHAAGVYSYWSQRSRNRPWNRGLRLDTFMVDAATCGLPESPAAASTATAAATAAAPTAAAHAAKAGMLLAEDGRAGPDPAFRIYDCQVLDHVEGSDHAPVLLQLELLS